MMIFPFHSWRKNAMAVWLALGLALLPAAKSGAQLLIVSNLNNTVASNFFVSAVQPAASEFTTGSLGYNLGNVSLNLYNAGGNTGALVVELWTGNTTQPTAFYATLLGSDPVGVTPANYTYSATGTVALAANTPYWILLSTPGSGGSGSYAWRYTADLSTTGTGTLGGLSFNNGSWIHVGTFNLLTQVNSAAVPEPGMYAAIFGGGMLAVAAWRKRKK